MSAGVATMRIVMWVAFKSLNILYIPVFIIRMFKRSKICPPITDDILLLPANELADKIRKQEVDPSCLQYLAFHSHFFCSSSCLAKLSLEHILPE